MNCDKKGLKMYWFDDTNYETGTLKQINFKGINNWRDLFKKPYEINNITSEIILKDFIVKTLDKCL